LASTPLRALLLLVFRRVRLWFRGVGFRDRAASQVPPDALERIDICWSVTLGLTLIDPIRGAAFQTRGLLLALRAGEPFRIARALAIEATHVASAGGGRAKRRAVKFLKVAGELACRLGHQYALALVDFIEGLLAYIEGSWKTGLEYLDR